MSTKILPSGPVAAARGPSAARRRHRYVFAVATLGFALNSAAWVSVAAFGSRSVHWAALGAIEKVLVVTLPLVVGSLGRIAAGILADRLGARVVLAALCVASAGALVLFAFAESPVELAISAVAVGVAGAAFAPAAALVIRAGPPHRRGLALGTFGVGIGGGAAAVAIHPLFERVDVRATELVLAGLLAAFGLLTALTTADRREDSATGPGWAEIRDLLRLPATRQFSALYAIAFAPHAATLLFLPAYLHVSYGDNGRSAVPYTAAFVAVGALARPAGAWLAEHCQANRILVVAFAAAGVMGVFLAFHPPQVPEGLLALGLVVMCHGLASGAVLQRVGETVPGHRAGTVIGTVGACGGLAALVPVAILGAVFHAEHSFAIGVTLVSATILLASGYVYLRTRWAGGLPVFPGPDADRIDLDVTATTVVALTDVETGSGGSAAVDRLAQLAAYHELIIVYAGGARRAGLGPHALVTALRLRLGRQAVVAIVLDCRSGPGADRDIRLLDDLIAEGAVAIAVVPDRDPAPTAVRVAADLDADLVLRLDLDPAGRTRLYRLDPVRASRC
jgi:MFS transporter, NNP family, nitrate/nitrite transporter